MGNGCNSLSCCNSIHHSPRVPSENTHSIHSLWESYSLRISHINKEVEILPGFMGFPNYLDNENNEMLSRKLSDLTGSLIQKEKGVYPDISPQNNSWINKLEDNDNTG